MDLRETNQKKRRQILWPGFSRFMVFKKWKNKELCRKYFSYALPYFKIFSQDMLGFQISEAVIATFSFPNIKRIKKMKKREASLKILSISISRDIKKVFIEENHFWDNWLHFKENVTKWNFYIREAKWWLSAPWRSKNTDITSKL